MSEGFYTKALYLLGRFVVLLASILIGIQIVFFYVLMENYALYLCYLLVLWFGFWYGTKTYSDYQAFRESLSQGLYFPRPSEKEIEALNMKLEEFNEAGLQACLLYQKGAGYKEIGRILQPQKRFHCQTVRRLIKKGLGILIEDYKKHNGKFEAK